MGYVAKCPPTGTERPFDMIWESGIAAGRTTTPSLSVRPPRRLFIFLLVIAIYRDEEVMASPFKLKVVVSLVFWSSSSF